MLQANCVGMKFFWPVLFHFGAAWLIQVAEFLLGNEETETKGEKEMDKENNDDSSEIGKSFLKPLSSDSTVLLFKDNSSRMGWVILSKER